MKPLPHPSSLPRICPSSSASSAPARLAVPIQSARGACCGRDSSSRAEAIKVSSPTGTLIKKIQRQPGPSTRTPPISGPTAVAADNVAPNVPMARNPSSSATLPASAQASDDAVKMIKPTTNTRRRPIRSPRVAAVSRPPARVRV